MCLLCEYRNKKKEIKKKIRYQQHQHKRLLKKAKVQIFKNHNHLIINYEDLQVIILKLLIVIIIIIMFKQINITLMLILIHIIKTIVIIIIMYYQNHKAIVVIVIIKKSIAIKSVQHLQLITTPHKPINTPQTTTTVITNTLTINTKTTLTNPITTSPPKSKSH